MTYIARLTYSESQMTRLRPNLIGLSSITKYRGRYSNWNFITFPNLASGTLAKLAFNFGLQLCMREIQQNLLWFNK